PKHRGTNGRPRPNTARVTNVVKPPCDEGVIRSAAAHAPCVRAIGFWVLAATILGSSMAFIDGTVVSVALPVLQTDLGATVSELQWIVESYALFLAALLLIGGSLGDRFGRRLVFAIGVGVFAVASMWCGLVSNARELIIARAVQGVGAALLVPGSLAIISASFSEKQRGQAIGTWSGFTAITAALGPVLGGWLVESYSWRWVFYINAPIAVAVLTILFWRVPESRNDESSGSLDWVGAALATFGLGALVFGLIESANPAVGSTIVRAGLVLGGVALLAFLIVEATSRAPMMPLRLFRSRTFTGANILTLFLYSALSGPLFFLPFNLIQVQGYSATAAGGAFLPLILIIFLLSRWAGSVMDRFGPKLPLVVGPTIAAVGYTLFTLPGVGGSYWTTFFPAVVVLGTGMAISVAPLTTAVMGAVEARHAGLASGINNSVSRTAGLISVAVMGVLVLGAFNTELDRRLEGVALKPETREALDAERVMLAAAQSPEGLEVGTTARIETAIDEAFVFGFRRIMFVACGLALASALTALVWIEGRPNTAS
ncbi:MAG: MFS transporter, partial [Vicinamibacteria bacterium]